MASFAKNFFKNFFKNRNFVNQASQQQLIKNFLITTTAASLLTYNNYQRYNSNSRMTSQNQQTPLGTQKPSTDFYENVIIFSGNANPDLAKEISDILGTSLGNMNVSRFSDGEINIQVMDNVRGKDVYIVQPTSSPVNENLMELLLMVSTMRRSSAEKINVVIPYYGYARQDRKCAPRVPISAADVAKLLETVGVDRVIAVDLHCGQIQGFFGPRVPVDNLQANIIALKYFTDKNIVQLSQDVTVVSPDAGGVARAKKFQEMLRFFSDYEPGLAMIIKHREVPGKVAQMYLVGDVKDRDIIIIDDMIDSAGTLSEACKELKKFGANKIYAFATHGLFSGNAFNNLNNAPITNVVVTNTIKAKPGEEGVPKIVRLSVAPLLAEAIKRIQTRESLSDLFSTKENSNKF